MQGERPALDIAIDNAIDDVARSMTEGHPSSALRGEVRARIGSSTLKTGWWRPALAVAGMAAVLAMWIGTRERTLAPSYVAQDIEIAAPAETTPTPTVPRANDLERSRAAVRLISPPVHRVLPAVVVFPDAPIFEPLTIEALPITTLNVDDPSVPLLEIPPMEIAPLEQIE